MDPLDDSLLQRACAGDDQAFCGLVERHQGMVRSFIAGYLHDRHTVYDLAQETFLSAHRKLEQFESGRDFGRWLRGIARTTTLMHLRSLARRRKHEQAAGEVLLQQRINALEQDEQQPVALDQVRDCMQRLAEHNPEAHELLSMRYVDDAPIANIAEQLDLGRGAVRVRLLRARKLISSCLEQKARLA